MLFAESQNTWLRIRGIPMTAVRTLCLAVLAWSAALVLPAAAQDMPPIWSGLYLGVHAGGMGVSQDTKRTSFSVTATSTESQGTVGGVMGGYNFQNGPWVYGVEMDGTWGCTDSACLYSARGRLGYATGKFLLFGTAGVSLHETGVRWTNSLTGQQVTQRDTAVGFIGGVGGEFRFAERWALRGEALFANHGTTEFTSPSGLTKLEKSDNVVIGRLGVTYHFK
jgi:outer membrane immunogenic protein